ncbi:hypothetical protein NXZ75_08885 [Lysinibacillus sphaericus]|uniref:hypothetical protein n=1 Tax=Lysinibacillus sphaericus TaxID=1421 RepID=UPI002161EB60|nr:hypothetical protein [Lysinibacillus sphaericus]MCS1382310.1 hypothetical protein [Lysinibacillus sphaericus]
MNKLKIETFIGEEDITAPVYKIESFPITNPLAVEKAQKILEENEGDYLCGFVSLIYNDVVIFGEEQITEDLLDTWCDLIYIFDTHYDGRSHRIVFLDNYPYFDTTIQENGHYYKIHLDRHQCFLVPIELFKREVKKEFFKFVEFCKIEKLQFAEDSLYRALLETYDELLY